MRKYTMYQFLLEFKSHAREEYLDHFDIPKLSIRCLKFEVAYHATFHIYPVTLKSDFSIPERKVRRDKNIKNFIYHQNKFISIKNLQKITNSRENDTLKK